ncbi:uncharacterized protein LOC135097790 [Scylla paramamosain]|uniref:uncharacterized protein LOC135097790 n=1 Tax=Scylla paramamosain TaxID=85552 RepID=UPI003083C2E4
MEALRKSVSDNDQFSDLLNIYQLSTLNTNQDSGTKKRLYTLAPSWSRVEAGSRIRFVAHWWLPYARVTPDTREPSNGSRLRALRFGLAESAQKSLIDFGGVAPSSFHTLSPGTSYASQEVVYIGVLNTRWRQYPLRMRKRTTNHSPDLPLPFKRGTNDTREESFAVSPTLHHHSGHQHVSQSIGAQAQAVTIKHNVHVFHGTVMSEHSVKTGDVRTSGHESINTHTLPYSPGVLFPAATRLLSDQSSPLEFSAPRYCAALPEDSPLAAVVGTLTATHTHGAEIKYSITGGNVGGLFTIDQRSGTVTLAVALDHELSHQHQLEVTAEAGGAAARAQLVVQIGDVNDNAPEFVRPAPRITVIEEDDRDLPATIARVEVVDADSSDAVGLAFRVSGDGVDQLGDGDAFFTINASTGDLIQLRVSAR